MKNLKLASIYKVARWEFLKTLRSPTFIVLTFIIPLLIAGAGGIGYFAQDTAKGEELNIAVIDKTESFYPFLEQHLTDTPIEITSFDGERKEVEAAVEENTFDGYLFFDKETLMETGEIPYYVGDTRDINATILREALQYPVTVYRLQELGLSEEQIETASTPVTVSPRSINGEEPHVAEFLTPLAMVMILIFAVIITGQVLMYGVIKEKKNRIVEILLSSISSLELMLGKVAGFGVLGLLQVFIWASVGFAVVSYFWEIGQFISFHDILPSLLIFIFGYLLLASIFAAVGATMKEAEGGSQIQGLVIIIPMIPLFISGPLIMSPNALWVRILSYLPPFNPVTSLLRLGAASLPPWEIASMIAVLILSAFLVIFLGAKIFEGGILQFDRSLTFKDLRQIFKK